MSHSIDCHEDVRQLQRDVFRMFVGQGRRVSYRALEAATGIGEETLRTYSAGVAIPLHNLLRLIRALPDEAANMLLEPSGYMLAPIEPRESTWDGLAAEAAGFVSDVCTARADGTIDHREDAQLKERTRKLIAEAQGVIQ